MLVAKDCPPLDWDRLVVPLTRSAIQEATRDAWWQRHRKLLKGMSMHDKFNYLDAWLSDNLWSPKARIQVANYVNALKRAGLLKEVKR